MDDKFALRTSQAGMRFIAQMTLYNAGNFERLRVYIGESYHPDLLVQKSVEDRIAELVDQREWLGKVRVRQLIGTGAHRVLILLEAEKQEGYFINELEVEEDYPHRVIEYIIRFE